MRAKKCLIPCAIAALAFTQAWGATDSLTMYRDAPQALLDSLPQAWTYDEHFSQTIPTEDAWWRTFDDPVLNELIARGIDYNYNAAMALKRIEVARRDLDIARAAYFPTVGASAGWTKSRTSGYTTNPAGRAADIDYFSLGLNVSWEIDLFGRVAKRAELEKANIALSQADYAAMQVSLAANIADMYITLRTYQAQLQVAREHIASQQKIVDMTIARHEAGLASMLDVTQARVVLYSTRATIPPLEASIRAAINSLAVLCGDFPGQLSADLSTPRPLPREYHLVGIGVPMDLLRRRPDVLQAEYQLAADAASIGIAKKDFLPTLSLQGSIGTSAHSPGDLFKGDSFTYTIAPTLSWTIFDGMSRRYAVQQAQEQMQIDIDSYNFTVQNAVEEVDNAILTYDGTLQNIALLEQVITESNRSLELSVDLYRNSLTPFSNVVDSQMNLLTYQNSLVSAQGRALKSLVNLYKALGGGWQLQ